MCAAGGKALQVLGGYATGLHPTLGSVSVKALTLPPFTAMKSLVFALALLATPLASMGATPGAEACPALLNKQFPRLQDETPQSLCQYSGKVLLVVNTASFCGFTKQYKGLEALHAKYGARGLVVLGFPSNDFGEQEPGSNKQIAEFCENTFNVKFPMFSKSVVKPGLANPNPLFTELTQATGSAPRWNFHKYLIDRQGRPVRARKRKAGGSDRALALAAEQVTQRQQAVRLSHTAWGRELGGRQFGVA